MPERTYELTKITVSKKNPTPDFPRKKDRPSKMVEVMSYPRPYGKQLQDIKRQEAMARQAESMKIPPVERLAMLDNAFGVGCGAQRERARLLRKIEKAKQVAVEVKDTPKPTAKSERDIRLEKQKRKEQHDKNKK